MKNKIKQELLKLKDEKYKKFQDSLCPGVDNIIGIRVPILRKYAIELLKEYDIDELLPQIDDAYYEEVMLQGMIIGLTKEKDIYKILDYIEAFVPKIDNWAVCDIFCSGLKIVKNNKAFVWEFIQPYLTSDKEFFVRFGLVIILSYYVEEGYLEEIFRICNEVILEGYYVKMAVSWLLSLCFIRYFEETKAYMLSDDCALNNFTYNKAIQKTIESIRITAQQKDILRNMKRM